jgi:hypothetical protein
VVVDSFKGKTLKIVWLWALHCAFRDTEAPAWVAVVYEQLACCVFVSSVGKKGKCRTRFSDAIHEADKELTMEGATIETMSMSTTDFHAIVFNFQVLATCECGVFAARYGKGV